MELCRADGGSIFRIETDKHIFCPELKQMDGARFIEMETDVVNTLFRIKTDWASNCSVPNLNRWREQLFKIEAYGANIC
jgi:hypothetical protein